MANLFKKIFGKNEKTTPTPLDPHVERYVFDFEQMPSIATYGISTVFCFGGDYSMFYTILKNRKFPPELVSSVKVKNYDIEEGEIALLTYPDPTSSPAVKYAICVFRLDQAENLENSGDDVMSYSSPYYILAKVDNKWAIGEIKPNPQEGNYAPYITTYYKILDIPDPKAFAKWVMEKEGLSLQTPPVYEHPY